jgi:ABC-2 type transport system ATP-binding protein
VERDGDTSLVVCEGLVHRYRGVSALDGVSFRLGPGVTGLVGVNGAGKSTLFNVVSGGLRATSGRVRIGGLDPYGRQRRRALRQVALMPQTAAFPKGMTAREVVEYLAWMRGLSVSRARAKAAEALEQVGLGARMSARMGQLSGGMARRVALAQALASDAEIILLDEPSTGLDPKQRRTMVDLVAGVTGCVLLSSHVLEDVAELADRVIVIDSGRVLFDGSLTELTDLAPVGTEAAKAAEAGFLSLLVGQDGGSR